MQRKVVLTADGSRTIHLEEWNENYHSHHGALQEAKHVFIDKVRERVDDCKEITILELGFGTGLNTMLTIELALELQIKINYITLEAYPVSIEEIIELNYTEIWEDGKEFYSAMHECDWEEKNEIHPLFSLTKYQTQFEDWQETSNTIDFIYFDAFGPRVQPHLWTIPIFEKMFCCSKNGAFFLTYCAKGQVRRDLESVGWKMSRLPGPPGKREMLVGEKVL
jgi:tRNA U34 5-methylaminomethyl-2-thiouridine-forming methyltransferase MnmC|tara:strand:- start:41326 stop:41991 length:666 start_codon:yes stop_codon:yes gene_type:complete